MKKHILHTNRVVIQKKISPDSAIYEFTFKLTFASTIAGFLVLTVQVLNLKKHNKIEQF